MQQSTHASPSLVSPAYLAAAVKPLRAEVLRSALSSEELIELSGFLTVQAAKWATEKQDPIAMVRAAREARSLARFKMETEDQRFRLAEHQRLSEREDLINNMLRDIVGERSSFSEDY